MTAHPYFYFDPIVSDGRSFATLIEAVANAAMLPIESVVITDARNGEMYVVRCAGLFSNLKSFNR